MNQNRRLADLLDKEEIREVIYLYCRGLDRADAEILHSVFHPGAVIKYGVYEGRVEEWVGFAVSFQDKIEATHIRIANILITLDGERARTESYAQIVHGRSPHFGESDSDLVIYCRFLDRFERREGKWAITRRSVVYDWTQVTKTDARWQGDFFGNYRPRATRGTDDPSYRLD
jgi:hypothetical protein